MKEKEENKIFTALSNEDIELLDMLKEKKEKLSILYRQFFFAFGITLTISGIGFLWFFNYSQRTFVNTLILIAILALSVVFLLFSSALALIKLWFDKRAIYYRIITRFTNRWLIGNFFDSARRMESAICLIRPDGIISYDKHSYIIDWQNIYYDEKRRPNILFPKNSALSVRIDNNKIVTADSKVLEEWRNTDFDIKELRVNVNSGNNNLLYIIIGVVIVVVLIYIATKTGNTTIVQNVTKVR